jgi:hypothetical protein
MKQTLKEAGYQHIAIDGKRHILKELATGDLEIWFANKNHASYGLIYKNTHLEFASSLKSL